MFKKKETKQKQKKSFWFSPKKILRNFKSIHWMKLKSSKDGTDGLLKTYGKVVGAMIITALTFVAIDALVSGVMSVAGMFG